MYFVCLERGADLHVAQLMPLPVTVSCFSKIQIGFTFLVPAHLGSPGKRPLNGCVYIYILSTKILHFKFSMYTMRQKKGTNFFLCASFLILDRNW